MNRVILAALIGAVFFLSLHRPASAMTEFCPAHLNYERVASGTQIARRQSGSVDAPTHPAQFSTLYGFDLSALGPRTITQATLAFDTTGGWYTLEVPATTLIAKLRHYSSAYVTFVRRDYVSPILYVRFPQAVTVNHAWVYNAAAQGDAPFGWQAQGTLTCSPPPAPSPEQEKHGSAGPHFYDLAAADRDRLSGPPAATSLILAAVASQPLESTDCTEPFREAAVKNQVTPDYPDSMRGAAGESMTSVEVAITSDGSLADAWVWGPSGFKAFDDASVHAARISTYVGARSYCQAVPGEYFFRVTFDPNS